MSKIVYTEEQEVAIKAMRDFLYDRSNREFTLTGAAGCGKTTILKEVLRFFKHRMIVAVAVSHAAKTVLNRAINEDSNLSIDVMTIAKLLGAQHNNESHKKIDLKASEHKFAPIDRYSLIIVDECSMIDDEMLKMIRERSKEKQIIFTGDMYQLPPVENENERDSSTFNVPLRADLVTPVRYDKIIGDLALYYRYLIFMFKEYNYFDWDMLKKHRPDLSNGTTSIKFLSREDQFMYHAQEYFMKDPENTRVLCYKNTTIDYYNSRLRNIASHHIKGFNSDSRYCSGETIIMNAPYILEGDRKSEIHNGEVFRIKFVGREEETVKITYINPSYRYDNKLDMEVTDTLELKQYRLTLNDPYSDEYRGTILCIHEDSEELYKQYCDMLIEQAKSLSADARKSAWRRFYGLKDRYADVSYIYAQSCHKAQGQTISNVFVHADDILGVKATSFKAKLQSLYVAVTRAKYNLVILLNNS